MAKKQKCPDCPPPGLPGWLATFGDLMSLLLTFFILLLSFSSVQESKFKEAIGSLQGALGVLESNQTIPIHQELLMALPSFQENSDYQEELDSLAQQLQQAMQELGINDDVIVENMGETVRIRIANPLFFDLGKADLKPLAKNILNKIIKVIKGKVYDVKIEGHTDDLPIKTVQFPSNWELSAIRAINVLRYFQDAGKINPKELSAVGQGEYEPIVPNISLKNRQQNRRVEIYIKPKEGIKIDDLFKNDNKK